MQGPAQLPDEDRREDNQRRNSEHEDLPVLQKKVQRTLHSLKERKSPGVNNVPSELLKLGGEGIIKTLTVLCQRV